MNTFDYYNKGLTFYKNNDYLNAYRNFYWASLKSMNKKACHYVASRLYMQISNGDIIETTSDNGMPPQTPHPRDKNGNKIIKRPLKRPVQRPRFIQGDILPKSFITSQWESKK